MTGKVDALDAAATSGALTFQPHLGRRLGRFFGLFSIASTLMGAVFLLSYRLLDVEAASASLDLVNILVRIYVAMLVVIAIGTWWIVLSHDDRELAEGELVQSMHHLEMTRGHLVESEKIACSAAVPWPAWLATDSSGDRRECRVLPSRSNGRNQGKARTRRSRGCGS